MTYTRSEHRPTDRLQSALTSQPAGRLSWRGLVLGFAGVVVICALTPYNDYALHNTPLVSCNLPIGVMMMLFCFVLLINGPLNKWAPHLAFTTSELAMALAMMLVSCALPSSGLMRYFAPSLVSPFWHARSNQQYLELLTGLKIPQWVFPSYDGQGPADWINDPAVTGYWNRWQGSGPYPYLLWLRPALTWAIFFIGLFGSILFLSIIVRRQWNENERLAFPLAQIQLALIQQPPPGRALNVWLARRTFWIAFGLVFFVHLWNGSSKYWPEHFPPIPLSYNLHSLMADPPLVHTDWGFQEATLYFTITGATYFASTSVAFSLWFFFVAYQVYRIILGTTTGDGTVYGRWDQHFGAILAFAMMLLWVGRAHWWLVVRQAVRGWRSGEPQGRYISYPAAAWGLAGCFVLMVSWLVAAGSQVLPAIITVMFLLILFLVIARVIAETGLIYAGFQTLLQKPFNLAVAAGWNRPVSVESYYLTCMLDAHHYDFREPLSVYSTHALKITDEAGCAGNGDDRTIRQQRAIGRKIIAAMALALVVGYFVSFASTLWTEYTYGSTKNSEAISPINPWGVDAEPRWRILDPTIGYIRGPSRSVHNPWLHIGAGFGVTALTGFLRLRFAAWPLHPIGMLLVMTTPGSRLWFSVLIGWLAKVMIVKFGGARLYQNAKPFFLGIIIGEAIAAGGWMLVGIVLSSLGVTYYPIHVLPW